VSDRDGNGTPEARAFMNGTELLRVELDRDGDGRADRWEYYDWPGTSAARGTPAEPKLITRAEEANGADATITRREYFDGGLVVRVEEDTDLDGRLDKWETYTSGVLARVDLDLAGSGRPTQRLTYEPSGGTVRVEADPDGDGTFEPVSSEPAPSASGPEATE
jgi:hypothetical protein